MSSPTHAADTPTPGPPARAAGPEGVEPPPAGLRPATLLRAVYELRHLLTPVHGYAELLMRHRIEPAQVRDMAWEIYRSSHTMAGLLKELEATATAASVPDATAGQADGGHRAAPPRRPEVTPPSSLEPDPRRSPGSTPEALVAQGRLAEAVAVAGVLRGTPVALARRLKVSAGALGVALRELSVAGRLTVEVGRADHLTIR